MLFAPPEARNCFPQPVCSCGSLATAQGSVCALPTKETLQQLVFVLGSSHMPGCNGGPGRRILGTVNDLSCLSALSGMFGLSPGWGAGTPAPQAQGQDNPRPVHPPFPGRAGPVAQQDAGLAGSCESPGPQHDPAFPHLDAEEMPAGSAGALVLLCWPHLAYTCGFGSALRKSKRLRNIPPLPLAGLNVQAISAGPSQP